MSHIDSLKKIADDARDRLALKRIVQDENLPALEAFCLKRKYQDVVNCARDAGIDLDTLEDLLVRIS